jgi:predicted MFS family arabinose efflux permease
MLLVYSIVGTVEHGFTSQRTVVLFTVSIALLAAFILIEKRSAAPLVRLGLLRLRSLAVANSAMLIVASGMFAFFYFGTLYIQVVLGFEPIKAGLAFLPFATSIGVGAGTAQAALRRLGVRATGAIGLLVAATGVVYMGATLAVDGSYWHLCGGMIAMAIGLGWTFVPFTLVATTNVADDEAGLASGIFNTSQQIGGALGLAILTTIFVNARDSALEDAGSVPVPFQGWGALQPAEIARQMQANVDGYQVAFHSGAGLMLVALVVHLALLRGRDVENIDVTAPPAAHAG